jgi:phosphate transport system ATP-binding protein
VSKRLPSYCPPHPPAALSAAHVSLSYGGRIAVRDASLEIPETRVTAIVGPSGCGKSSFLMCLNRLSDLIPDCKVTGKINFEGKDIFDRDIDVVELRRRVGMIFQRPCPFPTSIEKNLSIPLIEQGMRDKTERAAVAEAALKTVGLWDEVKDRLGASATGLSGGQQQRLCIARALVLKPAVLLMDEPCSSLDPIATGKIEELIHELSERQAVVIVTHDLAQARRVADNVALFWTGDVGTGSVLEHRTCCEFFDDPKHDLTQAYVKLNRSGTTSTRN